MIQTPVGETEIQINLTTGIILCFEWHHRFFLLSNEEMRIFTVSYPWKRVNEVICTRSKPHPG